LIIRSRAKGYYFNERGGLEAMAEKNERDFKCNDESCNEDIQCSKDKDKKGLKYRDLSIVYFQIFTLESVKLKKSEVRGVDNSEICVFKRTEIDKSNVNEQDEPIDKIVFSYNKKPKHEDKLKGTGCKLAKPVERFEFKGFSFKVEFDEPYPVEVSGEVRVEMSLFFNKTVSLAYTIVINRGEEAPPEQLLATDHVIDLISLAIPSEEWGFDESHEEEDEHKILIDTEDNKIIISKLFLDEDGDWLDDPDTITNEDNEQSEEPAKKIFLQVFERYKKRVMKICKDERCKEGKAVNAEDVVESGFVYVDIWESLEHCGDLFKEYQKSDRTKVMSHIFEYHKKELIGLMTMYPKEWPYRSSEAFEEVCGTNIAIDTDDLVLVNQNICIAFGTYGLSEKGIPSPWAKHLRSIRKHYNVSWPEYVLLLEMLLAQKHSIEYTSDLLLSSIISTDKKEGLDKKIERNAELFLETTKLLPQLDAVKYSKFISHKIMYERTNKRLKIDEDRTKLEELRTKVEEALNNVKDTRSMKNSKLLNLLIAGITVVSLFGFLFYEPHIPIFEYGFGYNVHEHHNIEALLLIQGLALVGVVGFAYLLIDFIIDRFKKK